MPFYPGLQYGDPTNLQGIREDIYYLAKVNAGFIGANDLLRIINKYYFKLQEVVRAVNENFYLQQATADLYIGDGSYSFPDGTAGNAPAYEKCKAIYAAFNPKSLSAPLVTEFEKVNIIDAQQVSDPSYVFTQPTALVYGKYFVLLPLVTDTTKYPVTDGVKMYYIAEQNKLVADTDVPVIFPSFHDAITIGALIDVARRTGDKKLRDDSIKEFADRLEDIKAYASDRLPPEIGVVEGQDNEGGWAYPWGNNNN